VAEETLSTTCCIVGGGPAGMMLGFLLARAGVPVVVLEKHKDFLRDFRGDTVHPSTLELMVELGLIDAFLALPHERVDRLSGQIGDAHVAIADFSHLPTHCRFIALMPQWDFLNFLAERGRCYRGFDLHLQAEATDLIEEDGRVVGVRARTPRGDLAIRADLVVGCDGRHSTVRERAGLEVEDIGAPIDVLWFRLSRRPDDTAETFGHIETGAMMVMINRGSYWQCAYVIPKGGLDGIRQRGLPAFRDSIVLMSPFVRDRIGEIASWDDVKLLTVTIDRLKQWHRPGLLCIGDAAHAMSPVGGVGINLAVQDAVAAANELAAPLKARAVTAAHLAAIQKRRTLPMRVIQFVQTQVQNRVLSRALASTGRPTVPLAVRLLQRVPALRRLPARLVGIGIRPEHIRTPEAEPPAPAAEAAPARARA
jgi:2-polyprenyl-6-methoxyphenol hydroxylase-like FAD-dependent oxidoreductase